MNSILKKLVAITFLTITVNSYASEGCSHYVDELREVKIDMEENLILQSRFHDRLNGELSGTYGVLRGWEGQKLYIKVGGFDTLKVFVDQVQDKTEAYEQKKLDNLKRIDDITFNLMKCLK